MRKLLSVLCAVGTLALFATPAGADDPAPRLHNPGTIDMGPRSTTTPPTTPRAIAPYEAPSQKFEPPTSGAVFEFAIPVTSESFPLIQQGLKSAADSGFFISIQSTGEQL